MMNQSSETVNPETRSIQADQFLQIKQNDDPLETQNIYLKQKIFELEQEKAQLNEYFRRNLKSLEEQMIASNIQKQSYFNLINQLEKKNFELQKEIIEKNHQIFSLNEQIQDQYSSASKMSRAFLKKQIQCLELQEKCVQQDNSLMKQLEVLKAKIAHADEKYDELSHICLEKDKQIISLRKKIKSYEKQISQLKNEKVLKPSQTTQNNENESTPIIESPFKQMQEQFEDEIQGQSFQSSIISAPQSIDFSASRIFQTKIEEIQKTINYQKKKISNLNQQNLVKSAEISELRKELNVIKSENKKYEAQLQQYKRREIQKIEQASKRASEELTLDKKQTTLSVQTGMKQPFLKSTQTSSKSNLLNQPNLKSVKSAKNLNVQAKDNFTTAGKSMLLSRENYKSQTDLNNLANQNKKPIVAQLRTRVSTVANPKIGNDASTRLQTLNGSRIIVPKQMEKEQNQLGQKSIIKDSETKQKQPDPISKPSTLKKASQPWRQNQKKVQEQKNIQKPNSKGQTTKPSALTKQPTNPKSIKPQSKNPQSPQQQDCQSDESDLVF